MQDIFKSFAAGKTEMESKQFQKLVKECKLIDKKFTQNDVDIVFSKVKVKGLKTITFGDFENALAEIAKKKGTTKDKIEEQIKKHGSATYAGTKADYVKFHDDKSQYTGVYARGGPTTVDAGRGGMVSDISQTCNRSKADVRGVVKK
jgi:hypothetical protein